MRSSLAGKTCRKVDSRMPGTLRTCPSLACFHSALTGYAPMSIPMMPSQVNRTTEHLNAASFALISRFDLALQTQRDKMMEVDRIIRST